MPSHDHDLSRRERQIMDVLHRDGKATAAEVLGGLPDAPSYSGVRAPLKILEQKGHIRHRGRGTCVRIHAHRPTCRRAAVRAVASIEDILRQLGGAGGRGTSLSGNSLFAAANKVSGLLRGGVTYARLTPGYETNDLGFLSRADQQTLTAVAQLVPSKPVGRWRNPVASIFLTDQKTASGLRNGSTAEAAVSGYTPSGARVSIDSWIDNPLASYCDRCARGGPALRYSPAYNTLVNLNANPRLRISPSVAAIYTLADEGNSSLWRIRPYVTFRVSTRVSAELGTRFQRNHDHTQYLATIGTVGADSTHYLFAHLDQDLLSFTSRLDVTLRPTLSMQLYAEPFVTAGHFTSVRELATPRAASYGARFRPYLKTAPDGDFNEKSFNASAVPRWEYRPASTLFVVWTQSRDQGDRDFGTFAARRDYRNLFAARPDNVFLVKAAYWLGR